MSYSKGNKKETINYMSDSSHFVKMDLGELETIINEATANSKLLKSQLDQLNPDKASSIADLTTKQAQFKELKEELEYQQSKREEEKTRYESTLDNLEQGLFAINQARKMFNDFLNVLIKNQQRFAFLEEGPKIGELAKEVNKLKHTVKLEGVSYLIHGLAHVTNLLQNDSPEQQETMSRKVLEIISQVENYIQKQRISEDLSEQARRDAFIALQQMFEDQMIFAQETITTLQGFIESISTKITSAENEKQEQDVKVSVKGTQMEDREIECRNNDLDYNKEKNKRDGERESLNLALDMVINELGQLKKEVIVK